MTSYNFNLYSTKIFVHFAPICPQGTAIKRNMRKLHPETLQECWNVPRSNPRQPLSKCYTDSSDWDSYDLLWVRHQCRRHTGSKSGVDFWHCVSLKHSLCESSTDGQSPQTIDPLLASFRRQYWRAVATLGIHDATAVYNVQNLRMFTKLLSKYTVCEHPLYKNFHISPFSFISVYLHRGGVILFYLTKWRTSCIAWTC